MESHETYAVNPKELRTSVGQRIRQARIDKGYSQTELGEKLGITHAGVGSYERGRLRITLQFLILLCNILEKPIYYFVEEIDEAKRKYEEAENKKHEKYDLQEKVEFEVEMAIRNYLRLLGHKDKIGEKVDNIVKYIATLESK